MVVLPASFVRAGRLYSSGSVQLRSQPKSVQQKIWQCKLRSSVDCKGVLKQKCKTKGQKTRTVCIQVRRTDVTGTALWILVFFRVNKRQFLLRRVSRCFILYRCFTNATSHPRSCVSPGTSIIARILQLDRCNAQLFGPWQSATRDTLGGSVGQGATTHCSSEVSNLIIG